MAGALARGILEDHTARTIAALKASHEGHELGKFPNMKDRVEGAVPKTDDHRNGT